MDARNSSAAGPLNCIASTWLCSWAARPATSSASLRKLAAVARIRFGSAAIGTVITALRAGSLDCLAAPVDLGRRLLHGRLQAPQRRLELARPRLAEARGGRALPVRAQDVRAHDRRQLGHHLALAIERRR